MSWYWSSRDLTANYKKAVIGFDFRTVPTSGFPERKQIQYKGTWFDRAGLKLSIEEAVWPSLYSQRDDPSSNDYSLAYDMAELSCFSGGVIVAFELPQSWVENDPNRKEESVHGEMNMNDFTFCGFDIVDCYMFRDASALYSFDANTEDIMSVLSKAEASLNHYGLVMSESGAIRAAVEFDEVHPEHAPFGPCGVWVLNWPGLSVVCDDRHN